VVGVECGSSHSSRFSTFEGRPYFNGKLTDYFVISTDVCDISCGHLYSGANPKSQIHIFLYQIHIFVYAQIRICVFDTKICTILFRMVQIFLCIHKFKRHKLVMTSNPFSVPVFFFIVQNFKKAPKHSISAGKTIFACQK
jgi:hypothetical protein